MKKTILIATAVFPPEPVVSARLSREIAENLMINHEVVVLCPSPSRPAGYNFNRLTSGFKGKLVYLDSYVCAESTVTGRFRESISFGNKLARYINDHKSEIACVYANVWPLFAQWTVVKTCKKNQIPCVLQIMDVYPESLTEKMKFPLSGIVNALFLPLDKLIIRNASHAIAISERMKNYLVKSRQIGSEKITVVRNWQQTETTSVSEKVNDKDEFLIMYAGSVSPTANLPFVIRSFVKLQAPNIKLVIAGDGSDKALCEEIVTESGNNHISFCSFNPNEVYALQAQANLLILSLQKGVSKTATPSKLTSYLFSEKPVLACVENDSDVADIIRNAACGFIAEPDNEQDLIEKMQQIAVISSEEMNKMGERAGNYAKEHFSAQMNLKKVTEIIESVMHA